MNDEKVSRRLAAIAALDAVGYSRLMEQDETGTLATLKSHLQAIEVLAAERSGRVVGGAGDSLLLEFASVVDAVDCVIAAQNLIAERNAEAPENRRMLFRAGVNLGDILVDGDNIFGEGVNIAARLEAIARPGGICITEEVRRLLPQAMRKEFLDAGERAVKNIERPLRIWQWKGASGAGLPQIAGVDSRTRVLVRPFEGRGGRGDQAYLAADLTDDIVAALAHQAAFVPADDADDPHDFTISGSVRWSGNRVRVTVHLTDEIEGTRVWSEQYDRTVDDVFAVEDDLTHAVIAAARQVMKRQEGKRLASRDISSLTVPELLSAAAGIFTSTLGRTAESRMFLERALDLQPNNAMAQAMMAMQAAREADMEIFPFDEAKIREVVRHASEGLRLEPNGFFQHLIMATVYTYFTPDIDAARREARATLERNAHVVPAQALLGMIDVLQGRTEEGLATLRESIDVDRHNIQLERYYYQLAAALFHIGDFDDAVSAATHAVELAPEKPCDRLLQAACLAHLGREAEAAAVIEEILAAHPDARASTVLAPPLYNDADMQKYREGLRRAGLPD